MANNTINLNEKLPPEEETEISAKTLDSADPASSLPDDQPNGSSQPPPPSAENHAEDVAAKEGEKVKCSTMTAHAGINAGPDDDIQKKIRRAERFGMPVQLSEAEKRSSRAERFVIVHVMLALCREFFACKRIASVMI